MKAKQKLLTGTALLVAALPATIVNAQAVRDDGTAAASTDLAVTYTDMTVAVEGDGLGDHTATESLKMEDFPVVGMADPESPQDGVNLRTLEAYIAAAGGSDNLGNHIATTNLNLSGFAVSNVGGPTLDGDAANKKYVDDAITEAGGSDNLGNHIADKKLDMADFGIGSLADPVYGSDAVNLRTMNVAIEGAKDNLGNHIATTNLSLSGFSVTGVAAPIDGADAANKDYVDGQVAGVRDGAVSIDTKVIAGQGLSGGGALDQDVTISFDTVFGDGRYAEDTVQVKAGTGLSGGGTLAGDVTVSFDAAYGDARYVNQTGNESIAGNKNFTGVVSVVAPSTDASATNKKYVDDLVSGAVRYYTAGSGLVLNGTEFAVDSTVVRTSGDQVIAGIKAFKDLRASRLSSANRGTISILAGDASDAVSDDIASLLVDDGLVLGANGSIIAVTSPDDWASGATGRHQVTLMDEFGDTALNDLSMDGEINMNNHKVVRVATPVFDQDAANKKYVDDQFASAGVTGGDGVNVIDRVVSVDASVVRTSGNQNIGGNKGFTGESVSWNKSPTAAADLTNKAYVDALVAASKGTIYAAGDGLALSGTTFAVDDTVVRVAGDQVIAGKKAFSDILTANGVVLSGDGSATAPMLRFDGDSNTGVYHPNTNEIGFAAGGVAAANITSTGVTALSLSMKSSGTATAPALRFASDSNTGLYRSTSDQISFATGGVARAHINNAGILTAKVTGLAAPVAGADAANKAYVDALVAANKGTIYAAGDGMSLSGTTFAVDNTVVRTSGAQSIRGNKTFYDKVTADQVHSDVINGRGDGLRLLAGESISIAADDKVGRNELIWLGAENGTKAISSPDNWASGWAGRHEVTLIDSTGMTALKHLYMMGLVDMNGKKVTEVGAPTAAGDAANKKYVDDLVAANKGTIYAAGDGLALSGTTFAVNNTVVRTAGAQSIDGKKTFTSDLDGNLFRAKYSHSTAYPAFSFQNDIDTGMYRLNTNEVGFSAGGVAAAHINTSGVYANGFATKGYGSAAAPVFRFSGDSNTGMYRSGTDQIGLATGGVARAHINSRGLYANTYYNYQKGSAALPAYTFTSDTNTGIYSEANDTVSFASGGKRVGFINSSGLYTKYVWGLATPSRNDHAANKQYVDNKTVLKSKGSYTTIPETGNTVLDNGVYSYNVYANTLGDATPKGYWSALNFGRGNGSVQIAGNWTSGGNELWFRSKRDTSDNWATWKEVLHSNNLSSYATNGVTINSGKFAVDSTVVRTTGDQTISGKKTFTADVDASRVRTAIHNAGYPSFSFMDDTNTGMYRSAADQIGFATGGVARAHINSYGIYANNFRAYSFGTAGLPTFNFASDTNTGMYRSNADQIGFATGGVARAHINSYGLYANNFRAYNLGSAAAPTFNFAYDTNTGIYRSGADQIGFATGGVARAHINNNGITTSRLMGLRAPISGTDAANKDYVDSRAKTYTQGDGISISGSAIAVNNTVVRTSGNQTVGGVKTFSSQVVTPRALGSNLGSAAAPVFSFAGDSNTGIYSHAGDTISFSTAGVRRVYINNTGFHGGGRYITNLNMNNAKFGALHIDRIQWRRAGDSTAGVLRYNGSNRSDGLWYSSSANPSNGTKDLKFQGDIWAFQFYSRGYFYHSDENLKKNIQAISGEEGLATVLAIEPVTYDWKSDGRHANGVIAQQVRDVLPEIVDEDANGMLTVDYTQMIPHLLAAVQELNQQVKDLEAELAAR